MAQTHLLSCYGLAAHQATTQEDIFPVNNTNTMNDKKVSSYIAQYPILRIAQSALHITSLADLFNQTPSQLLWEASSHMLQLMREGCSYTYPPLARWKNLPTVLTPQHRIQTRVLLVESLTPYPWATALTFISKQLRRYGIGGRLNAWLTAFSRTDSRL